MASTSSSSTSPSKAAGVRARARFPKARPNVLGAERRAGTSAPSTPKPTTSTDDSEAKVQAPSHPPPPPPVRRIVRLDFTPPNQILNPDCATQQSASCQPPRPSASVTPDAHSNLNDTETSECLPESVQPHSPVAVVKKVLPDAEKAPYSQAAAASKQRERKLSSRGGNENKEKEQAKKQRHKKVVKPPERSKMTMFDLIYWNPTSNPMTYEEDECRVPLSSKEGNVPDQLPNSERLAEEAVDDPENMEESLNDIEESGENTLPSESDGMPVPQVKIGPDGRIVLDEQSLVIETTAAKKDLSSSPAVYERSSNVTYSSFRDKKSIKTWTSKETAKFYMALSSVGTDFSMMGNLFPKRSRNELKLKFKKEDRLNKALVDKAIRDHHQYDLSLFEDSDEEVENQISDGIEKARKAQRRRATREKKKPVENGDACDINKKKTVNRKKKSSKQRQCWQEESDSDPEMSDAVSNQPIDATTPHPKTTDTALSSESVLINVDNSTNENTIPDSQIQEEQESDISTQEDQNFDDDEGCNDSEKILEGVLKQTRSGRQPKKKSPFTISIEEPKKQRKKKLKLVDPSNKEEHAQCNFTDSATASVSARTTTTVNADSGNLLSSQLIMVAEAANPDGSQLFHLYMLTPPVHSSGEKVTRSPLSEHDYSKQTWSCDTNVNTPTRLLKIDGVKVISAGSASPLTEIRHTTVVDNTAISTQSCGTGDALESGNAS